MSLNIYWVGLRASEVKFTNNFFSDYITIFGSKKNKELIQPLNLTISKNLDHNDEKNDKIITDYQKNIGKVLAKTPEAKFMFYNQIIALKYYKENSYIICINKKELIDKLENKIITREYFKKKDSCFKSFYTKWFCSN